MKKLIYRIFALSALCLVANACSDEFKDLNKGDDTLTITPSATTVALDEGNHDSDALTLDWSTGTNYGTGNKLNYTLEFALDGTNFANPITYEMGTETYSWSRNVEELNEFVTKELGVKEGETATIEARIVADVVGYTNLQQTAQTKFTVSTYTPVTSTLYMVGTAAPNGTDLDKATKMTRSDNGIFTITCALKHGKFKFITTLGEELPSYNASPESESQVTYRTTADEPDGQWTIPMDGYYEVTVNLLEGTITITKMEGSFDRFDHVYFVGSFTNWSFVEMDKDPLRQNLWRYGAEFNSTGSGEFKFGTVTDWVNMLFASQPNAPYTSQDVVYNSDADNKWVLTAAQCNKPYKITLDVTMGSEKMIMKQFTPYTGLYLVGDATPNGWVLGNATAMTKVDDYTFTWTGKLTTGELKISCDKKSDWMGAWFMATYNGANPTGSQERTIFVDKSDSSLADLYPDINYYDVDMKWKISSAGTYTITINQLTERISIVKK